MSITCKNCKTELPDTAKFCLNCGAEVKVSSHEIHPVVIHSFLVAVQEGDLATVEQRLRQDPRFANIRDIKADPETALHYAVKCSDDEIRPQMVQLLLNFGAQVNTATREGVTPLHVACEVPDNLETVKVLVEHGANVRAQTRKKVTPLEIAYNMYMDGHRLGVETTFDVVMYLGSKGANPNVVHKATGNTPLKYAKFLLRLNEAMADTLPPDKKGEVLYRLREEVRLLREYGAKDEE